MFVNSELYLGSYTPVGDIIVLALCIVMGILIKQTHIGKEKTSFSIIRSNFEIKLFFVIVIILSSQISLNILQ